MNARLICCALLIVTMACAKQYRTSDPQISGEQVLGNLSAIQGTTVKDTGAAALAQALVLKNSTDTTVYYADAPSPMGTVASVISVNNLGFLDSSLKSLTNPGVAQVRIFFLDNPFTAGGRQDVLLVGIATPADQGVFKYFGFTGSGDVSGGQFSVKFTSDTGAFTLRSSDLSGKSLAATIQLRVYSTDASGNETYIGKFSTLAGFQ